MALSMTGFGNYCFSDKFINIKCEVLCINKRNIEIYINFPKFCSFSELHLRKIIEKELIRGKISVSFDINITSGSKRIVLDEALFKEWYASLQKLAKKYNFKQDLSVSSWLLTENIWKIEDIKLEKDELLKSLEESLKHAINKVRLMRKSEGRQIGNDINKKLKEIETLINEISGHAPVILQNYTRKIQNQVRKSNDFEQKEKDLFSRFVSVFSEKIDVCEEITRLKSHIIQFKKFIKSEDPIGRSLDFLLQEILREINTIGSKIQDLLVSQNVIKIKTLIEQIREQSQNIL